MPLNLETAENGSYTLHFDNVLACFDYLHLIDNLTGTDVDLLFGLGVLYLTRKRRDD